MADKKPKQRRKHNKKNKSKDPGTQQSRKSPEESQKINAQTSKVQPKPSMQVKTRSSGPILSDNDSSLPITSSRSQHMGVNQHTDTTVECPSPSPSLTRQGAAGGTTRNKGSSGFDSPNPAIKVFTSDAGVTSPPILAFSSPGRGLQSAVNTSPSPSSLGLVSAVTLSSSISTSEIRQPYPHSTQQGPSTPSTSSLESENDSTQGKDLNVISVALQQTSPYPPSKLNGFYNRGSESLYDLSQGRSPEHEGEESSGSPERDHPLEGYDHKTMSNILDSLAFMKNKVSKLDSMEVKLSKLDSLESINLSVRGNVSKVQSRLDDMGNKFSKLTNELSKQDKRCEARSAELASKISKVENERKNIKLEWEAYKVTAQKDVSKMQTEVNNSRAKIRELEAQIVCQAKKLDSIAALEEGLKQAQSLAAQLKEKLDSVDNLEDKIKKAAEDKFEILKAAVKKEVRSEIIHEFRVNQRAANAEVKYDILKGKAQEKIRNVVVHGLAESNTEADDFQCIKDFFKDRMGLPNLDIDMVRRLGPPHEDPAYTRPVVVSFARVSARWRVWNKRWKIVNENRSPAWIQEDLPKQLREDLRVLQRIAKMARLQPDKYAGVRVRDFKIRINDTWYGINELRKLPPDLQPEVTYTPRSQSSVIFFTKQSPLSNHFTSHFKIDGVKYTCVEQYLAHRRAALQGNDSLAEQAFQSDNPAHHKVILNMLRREGSDLWHQQAERIAYPAVRAKFLQNKHLADFLVATHPLAIGEASKDKFWGTGLSLENKDALDPARWAADGNLLGRILTAVRQELVGTENPPQTQG